MSSPQVRVFISHSWNYAKHYETLVGWIRGRPWRWGQAVPKFLDYSVPKDDPVHNAPTDKLLRSAIRGQIAQTHVVVISTGMYATHSKWINIEIELAAELEKPILAVHPWAQSRKSRVVQQHAKEKVGWNQKSVLNGIWKLYREQA